MVDQLKEIPKKILEWWNKFAPKQKTLIISAAAGILVAFAVLIWILSKPQYVTLAVCETTKETAQITELLDGADPVIEYRVSTDGYTIEVLKEQESQAAESEAEEAEAEEAEAEEAEAEEAEAETTEMEE